MFQDGHTHGFNYQAQVVTTVVVSLALAGRPGRPVNAYLPSATYSPPPPVAGAIAGRQTVRSFSPKFTRIGPGKSLKPLDAIIHGPNVICSIILEFVPLLHQRPVFNYGPLVFAQA